MRMSKRSPHPPFIPLLPKEKERTPLPKEKERLRHPANILGASLRFDPSHPTFF
tara:strand:- start:809 stop:970 length:162 start_codon:yes stop_codon:yes gene_type:complete